MEKVCEVADRYDLMGLELWMISASFYTVNPPSGSGTPAVWIGDDEGVNLLTLGSVE